LAASPARTVPFVTEELKKGSLPAGKVTQLIADLDANDFITREKATRELAGFGAAAEPGLREAVRKGASAEAGRRIEGLLSRARSNNSPTSRRWSRAVQALEYAGTPEARELLGQIGKGPVGSRAGEQARGALDRLALRAAAGDRKRP
jgi:hypothetical protein